MNCFENNGKKTKNLKPYIDIGEKTDIMKEKKI